MTALDADGFIGLAGQFPRDWERTPFWARYRRVKRAADGSEELLSVYRDFGVIRKSDRDDNFNKASDDLTKYQVVRAGDLVINKMKAWQGSVAVSSLDGIVSPAYFVFEPVSASVPRFAHFLLRSGAFIEAYRAASKGIRPNQWDLDPDLLRGFPLPLPSVGMQTAIVEFLDRETAEIDAFIADQEELIGLLAERRAATISHAVTKGLDPTVPMKDSGVEWLGEVNADWSITRLKNIAEILPGFAFSSDSFSETSDAIPLLRGINVGVGKIDWKETVSWDRAVDAGLETYLLREGDIVVGLDRPIISGGVRVARVGKADAPSLLVQRVARIRATGANSASFIEYLMGAQAFADYLSPLFTGVSVPHISPSQVGDFGIAVPLPEVQARVVQQLDFEVSEIDEAISDAKEAIALSRERRAALISAAVTGKIDVREHGAVA